MGRFSDEVLDHFESPRNRGSMEDADLIGVSGSPGRGPFVIFYLKAGDGRVVDVRFNSHGCGPTIAAGSALTELVKGRSLGDCGSLGEADVLAALGGLPPDKQHCAAMAILALRAALEGPGA